MKTYIIRYILFLSLFASGQLTAWGQLDPNRSTTTKIADLLASQPAENPERLNQTMLQLEQFTASDLSALLQQLKTVGDPANSPILYAVNSYSYHVRSKADAPARYTFNEGVLDALNHIKEPVHGRFLIGLLSLTANDQTVPALSTYLSMPDYRQSTAEVLASIASETAGQALLKALRDTDGPDAIPLIHALGNMSYAAAEKTLISWAEYDDTRIRHSAYTALAQIGSQEGGAILQQAAKEVSYAYEASGVTAALFDYLERQQAKGTDHTIRKSARQIFRTKQLSSPVRSRALHLLVDLEGPKQINNLVKGALDTDPAYSQTALSLLSAYSSDRTTSRLVKNLHKAPAAVQINILRYLGAESQHVALPVVKDMLSESDGLVSAAAARTLHQLMGDASIPWLLPLLSSPSERSTAIQQILMSSSSPELAQQLIQALSEETDENIQENLLQIIGKRHIAEAGSLILELAKNAESPTVKNTAQSILPHVVREEFLPELLDLMSVETMSARPDMIEEVIEGRQNAIMKAVLQSGNPEAQSLLVLDRFHREPNSIKASYFPIFAGVANEQMLEITVEAAFNHEDPAVRNSAITSLASWASPEAIPSLIRWIRMPEQDDGTRSQSFQHRIVRGLVQQIEKSDLPAPQQVLLLRDLFHEVRDHTHQRMVLTALESTQTLHALFFAGRYLDDDHLKSAAANTVMGIALNNPQYAGPSVIHLLEKTSAAMSGSESSYLREAIAKHITALSPEPGFVPLFNGENLEGWKGLVADPIRRARMDEAALAEAQWKADEVMRGGWYVADGELHFNGQGDNIATTKDYGDIEMYIDWKLAADGSDGDAGIYLRGTPQVQIWDTSRVNVGAQVGSGGLYNNQKNPDKPLLVADNALGEWNTFYITMVGDRVTVYLNGHLVTDDVVLENYWDRNNPINSAEQIELQAHGTHVSYRDIYVRELPRKEIFQMSQEEMDDGFTVLFDGTSLEHWTGNTADYVISDENTLAVYPKEGSGGNLYTREEYDDFVFRFSFRLTPGANNGVGIRTPMEGDAAYVGMEIQVLDDGADIYQNLHDHQYHGSVYGIMAAERGHLKPVGQWNEEEIYIKGHHIRVTLNGVVIVEGDLEQATKDGTLDGLDHPGWKNRSGHIGFLGHGSEVHFRDIRIKKL